MVACWVAYSAYGLAAVSADARDESLAVLKVDEMAVLKAVWSDYLMADLSAVLKDVKSVGVTVVSKVALKAVCWAEN